MQLFGKKKAAAKPAAAPVGADPLQTIMTLRGTLEKLEKREQHIQLKSEQALSDARQKANKKDKKGALFALKRKKMYESEIAKLQGARITMETQIMSLESATVNIETFKAMSQGAAAMKTIRGNIDADTVQEMMDDIDEERQLHNEIADAISRPGEDMFDDEELLQELAELEQLDLDEQLMQELPAAPQGLTSSSTGVFQLPVAPTGALPQSHSAGASSAVESEEQRQLRELEASMMVA